MSRDEARAVLEAHNRWRRGDDAEYHENPWAIGRAIDIAVAELAKPAAVPDELTDKQVVSACFSYRHDYGLLDDKAKGHLEFQCREWWRALRKELECPSKHPMVLAAAPQPPAPAVDEGRQPLDCLHINRGSLDAAADAYEAEFDNAKCREAFDNRYHKIKAAVSYDEWQAIWFKALEHERRKTAPAVSPVDIQAVREVIAYLRYFADHDSADQLARAIGDEPND